MVADRSVQEGIKVDEATLLAEALGDLHAELLEGFMLWRAGMYACEDCNRQMCPSLQHFALPSQRCGVSVVPPPGRG